MVTGGSGSGKSAYAEQLVLKQGDFKRYYIATMRPWDEECVKKIERHQNMRVMKNFETIECYEDLHRLCVEQDSVILLECMSNLVAHEFYRSDLNQAGIMEYILNGIYHLQRQAKVVIVVTNEVFSDGVIYDEETLTYQKVLALVNRGLGNCADWVIEVVYGIPEVIKEPATAGKDKGDTP